MNIEERIRRLERQNQRLRWTIACLAVAGLAVASLGAAGLGDLLVQGKVEVQDSSGKTKTVLDQNGDAQVGKDLTVTGDARMAGEGEVGKSWKVKGDVTVGGDLILDGKSLKTRVDALEKSPLRLVCGSVDMNGQNPKVRGGLPDGSFKVDRTSEGVFDVTFTPPFSSTPSVVASHVLSFNPGTPPGGSVEQYVFIREITPNHAVINLGIGPDPAHKQPEKPADRPFSFIAIGSP